MPSHRSLRIAEAIREVVSSTILFELADPRVRAVTVLRVEVPGDLRNASVFVSIMGSDAEQDLVMRGLRHATGFIQSRVAARLQTRSTPVLTFKRDDSVKRSIAMTRLIDDALAADRDALAADRDAEEATGPGSGPGPEPESEPESEPGSRAGDGREPPDDRDPGEPAPTAAGRP